MSQIEYKIKNFGNDRVVSSVDALQAALMADYKSKSVSVLYVGANGMRKVLFICVDENGVVRHSYEDQAVVDFDELAG